MNSLRRLTVVELRLILREPIVLFFGLAFAPVLVVILGSIPSFRRPDTDIGGARMIDLYTAIATTLVLAIIGATYVPAVLATYRERGVLRRLSTTPLPAGRLLGAEFAAAMGVALTSIVAVLAIARLAFAVALPRQVLGYAVALVLTAAAVFALGLLVAALAPSGKAAGAIGNILFFPVMFFAGLWAPRESMPSVLRRISDFTPLGAGTQALRDASAGAWPHPLHLAVLAGYLALFSVLAARVFRWE